MTVSIPGQYSELSIAGRRISKHSRAFLIAEIAQTHDGSLGLAHAFIDSAANAGADAIKFQTHYAAEESTSRDRWRVKFSFQDNTRYDYWRRMEFSDEQWAGLAAHARERGIVFLSTPFSPRAIELLERLDVPAWKIGSGEIDNDLLIERLSRTGKPLIISTGMSTYREIDCVHANLKGADVPHALLHCTSEYPVKAERFGMNVIGEMFARYSCPIGLSSHMPNWQASFAAVVQGACIVEHHFTLSREMFGPDVAASLEPNEFRQLAESVKTLAILNHNPVNKDEVAVELGATRTLFRKSIVASQRLDAGTKIEMTHLAFKKPGDGLHVSAWRDVIGKTLTVAKAPDDLIQMEDLE